MGQVVNLKELEQPKPAIVIEEAVYKRVLAKFEKQKKELKALKASNRVLVELLQDPYNEYVRLINIRMRRQDEERRQRSCTCIPDRASALR